MSFFFLALFASLFTRRLQEGVHSSSDPYVTISILDSFGAARPESVQQTRVVDKSLMPVWDQVFRLQSAWRCFLFGVVCAICSSCPVPPHSVGVVLSVWDKDLGAKSNDDFMGQVVLLSADFLKLLGTTGSWIGWRALEPRAGRNDRVAGKLHFQIDMDPTLLSEQVRRRGVGGAKLSVVCALFAGQ